MGSPDPADRRTYRGGAGHDRHQHSGSGKANQYFLRGFNLDHGTDFSLTIDDVPMNFRTHGHGQGYLDVGGLIPDVIRRIDYRKGPYRADVGDFALVGIAQLTTVDRFDAPYISAEVGSFDWKRIGAGGSIKAGGGDLLAAAEFKTYDGPWELPEAHASCLRLRKIHPRHRLGRAARQPVDL
ncbi:TonB-dependent receptor plug domain-containing protein [Brevundimonas nasdae]|uniref:TonB-dependent receptor plug domain-containing protein n=1 Tax=Brevundimonas nasdae TaxID=172043 RepID=A0ABX8TP84_9CAUL|nr:TonB-dependent receptor plug domain-containing protein [Brevundimonas nasdae]QYC15893.1 TonB-dependent receptor plug domain-containing protein [Brevundimonas nasdae]